MINIQNIQKDSITLTVDLAGGSGTRSLAIPGFASGQITDAEYSQNPDYYNELVQQGQISLTTPDILNQVEDEPANHQIGSSVSGGGPTLG